jgi:hypothetical protein
MSHTHKIQLTVVINKEIIFRGEKIDVFDIKSITINKDCTITSITTDQNPTPDHQ